MPIPEPRATAQSSDFDREARYAAMAGILFNAHAS